MYVSRFITKCLPSCLGTEGVGGCFGLYWGALFGGNNVSALLEDSVFENCVTHGVGLGGAVSLMWQESFSGTGTFMTAQSSQFDNCRSGSGGGGGGISVFYVAQGGGTGLVMEGIASSFVNNHAGSLGGGAVQILFRGGETAFAMAAGFLSCNFAGNTASGLGGGAVLLYGIISRMPSTSERESIMYVKVSVFLHLCRFYLTRGFSPFNLSTAIVFL